MIINKLTLILIISLGSLHAKASFDENARRYLSAQEIVQTMQLHFDVIDDCAKVNERNASLLGVNSAVTGSSIAPAPTQTTVQFIAGCVSKALDRAAYPQQYPEAFAKVKVLLGEQLVKKLSEPYSTMLQPDDAFAQILRSPWNQVAPSTREEFFARLVFVMLGSDELIQDFGLIDPVVLRTKLAGAAQIKPQASVADIIKFVSVNLAVRDEFLSY